jgi:dihydroflavonol-4-reductase
MPKKIFITGATGYLGSSLLKKLYDQKHKITIFVPKNTSHPFLKGLKIKRINGDIRDYASLLKAMKGCDYVYHLAACILNTPKAKKTLFSVNIRGTENVMKACLKLGVKKIVHVSSRF